MTLTLTQMTDLQRVRIAISDFPNGAAKVERSLNELLWMTVRGGVALPISGGEGQLDDFEWFSDQQNFYRVSSASLEDTVDVFTADGTWNKPVGLVAARVTVQAPGGGSGGLASGSGQGESACGSGGEAAIAVIPAASLGSSETVTIGSAGAAGSSGGGNGGDGGTTSFGGHLTAEGGNGGDGATVTSGDSAVAGGNGGTGGGGTASPSIHIQGGDGSNGRVIGGDSIRSGLGGGSLLGSGGRTFHGGGSGQPGRGYGGGGGGSISASGDAAGAAGAPGLIIVEHFFAGQGP